MNSSPLQASRARVLDLDSLEPVDDELHRIGFEALAATLDEDVAAANEAIRLLAAARVVAFISNDWTFEVRETLLGWVLGATRGTPDVADLALAASIRARRLAEIRGAES